MTPIIGLRDINVHYEADSTLKDNGLARTVTINFDNLTSVQLFLELINGIKLKTHQKLLEEAQQALKSEFESTNNCAPTNSYLSLKHMLIVKDSQLLTLEQLLLTHKDTKVTFTIPIHLAEKGIRANAILDLLKNHFMMPTVLYVHHPIPPLARSSKNEARGQFMDSFANYNKVSKSLTQYVEWCLFNHVDWANHLSTMIKASFEVQLNQPNKEAAEIQINCASHEGRIELKKKLLAFAAAHEYDEAFHFEGVYDEEGNKQDAIFLIKVNPGFTIHNLYTIMKAFIASAQTNSAKKENDLVLNTSTVNPRLV